MTCIDPIALDAVRGGAAQPTYTPTDEQREEFARCAARAKEKAWYKPWTWGRKTIEQCYYDMRKRMQGN